MKYYFTLAIVILNKALTIHSLSNDFLFGHKEYTTHNQRE